MIDECCSENDIIYASTMDGNIWASPVFILLVGNWQAYNIKDEANFNIQSRHYKYNPQERCDNE